MAQPRARPCSYTYTVALSTPQIDQYTKNKNAMATYSFKQRGVSGDHNHQAGQPAQRHSWEHRRGAVLLPPPVSVFCRAGEKSGGGEGEVVSKTIERGIDVLRAWGVSPPALRTILFPFRAGPRKTRSPMDPPGKAPLPRGRTSRARPPNIPEALFPHPVVYRGGTGMGWW